MTIMSRSKKKPSSVLIRPQLEVLGVYRLSVTPKLLDQQFESLNGYAKSTPQEGRLRVHCKRQLESVVLIEVIVKNRDDNFQIGDFTQEQEGRPRDGWQAPWGAKILAEGGESLVETRWNQLPQDKDLRLAFYLHYYQPDKPLLTSYGERNCPPVEAMPARLRRLVPFEPVD
jgi:hypothetical protein